MRAKSKVAIKMGQSEYMNVGAKSSTRVKSHKFYFEEKHYYKYSYISVKMKD